MFTYAHVKWFNGQSERAYYLNYFINSFYTTKPSRYRPSLIGATHAESQTIMVSCTQKREARVCCSCFYHETLQS